MNRQRSLFDDDSPACDTDGITATPAQQDTSVAAAAAIRPLTGAQRLAVLAYIVAAGPRGVTDEEGMAALMMNPNAYRPRRVELSRGYKGLAGGWIEDSGQRRRTASGQAAIVWVATAKGRQAVEVPSDE